MTDTPSTEPSCLEPLPGQMDLPFDSSRDDIMNNPLLVTSLQCAVPLWIIQIKDVPWQDKKRRAEECSQIVAEKGDVILFKGGKRGETAAAFNALAEGIAILSFAPGGVRVFGEHWDAAKIIGRLDEATSFVADVELDGLFEGLLDGVM